MCNRYLFREKYESLKIIEVFDSGLAWLYVCNMYASKYACMYAYMHTYILILYVCLMTCTCFFEPARLSSLSDFSSADDIG